MGRSERSTAAEARRARTEPKLHGRRGAGEECSTGHPALFTMAPVLELGRMPEGGGYPVGFVEAAAAIMGADLGDLVHLCAGSVRGGRLTIDLRAEVLPAGHRFRVPGMRPDVCADVRWLPLGHGTVDAVLVDPPYSADHAGALWNAAKQYPTPTVLLREVAAALRPGGRVGFLHHLVPSPVPGLRTVGVYGVTTGTGYRIRAFTVLERLDDGATLLEPGEQLRTARLNVAAVSPRSRPPGGRVDLLALAGAEVSGPLEELPDEELEAIADDEPNPPAGPAGGALEPAHRPPLLVAAAEAELDRRRSLRTLEAVTAILRALGLAR